MESATHHLPRRHANGLHRELPSTHIEQVLQARAQEIDDEDVVQALLSKVVYLRDSGCMTQCAEYAARDDQSGEGGGGEEKGTDDSRQGYDTSDTHRATEEPPLSSVPVFVSYAICRHGQGGVSMHVR